MTVPVMPGCGIGFKVHGGNTVGVFVTATREDGPTNLQRGDQILEVSEHPEHPDMGNFLREAASKNQLYDMWLVNV